MALHAVQHKKRADEEEESKNREGAKETFNLRTQIKR